MQVPSGIGCDGAAADRDRRGHDDGGARFVLAPDRCTVDHGASTCEVGPERDETVFARCDDAFNGTVDGGCGKARGVPDRLKCGILVPGRVGKDHRACLRVEFVNLNETDRIFVANKNPGTIIGDELRDSKESRLLRVDLVFVVGRGAVVAYGKDGVLKSDGLSVGGNALEVEACRFAYSARDAHVVERRLSLHGSFGRVSDYIDAPLDGEVVGAARKVLLALGTQRDGRVFRNLHRGFARFTCGRRHVERDVGEV